MIAYQLIGFVKDENIEMVQFHQSYSYEDFVQGIRPSEEGGFERRNGIFPHLRRFVLQKVCWGGFVSIGLAGFISWFLISAG